jgi:tetratricopeptide (TPR) repeat protein
MPDMVQFPLAKASFLLIQKKNEEALEIFERVLKKAPDSIEALSGVGVANLNMRRFGPAIAAFEKGLALRPTQRELLNGLGVTLVTAQDAKKAAMIAEYALTQAPHDQSALALLGTAWRLLNDEREHELNGYDCFIRAYDLDPPEGYADMDAFNRDLNAYMDGLHPEVREYVDQSLRNGTQTLGNIFNAGHNLVDRLKRRIEQAVNHYITELPADTKHPLTSRRSGGFTFSGSWSSRLRDCGYHTNHIHPGGWISSAYYIALPETVADMETKAGWIKFGEPGYDIALPDPVRRAIQPKPGRLVLFPSYMWHGTVPFRSAQARTTIAFDVVPDNLPAA